MATSSFDLKKKNISEYDYNMLETFYLSITKKMAIADVTEIVDVHTGKFIRRSMQIKRILNSPSPIPFVFVSCLN